MRGAKRWTTVVLLAVLGFADAGCAGRAWQEALAQDTPGAYRRFLEESPRSVHVPEAQERLDYLTTKRNPTAEAVERFREAHPQSADLGELERLLEARGFAAARMAGSAAAYRQFLERFPNGVLTDRASANLEYRLRDGFSGRPGEIVAFLASHPEGDHADEARRTMALLAARQAKAFRSAVLRIEIDPALADAERLRRAFSERAQQAFAGSGVRLVGAQDPSAGAIVSIQHVEARVPTQLYEGRMEAPGVLATTQVSLTRVGEDEPIWSEVFTLRVPLVESRGRDSVLFTRRGSVYWDRFFVPVATWTTQSARHGELPLREGAVAVAGDVDRAIALFEDGVYQELDLSDPAAPRLLGEYARRSDLSRFSGLRVLGERVVLFGEDGMELVDRNAGAPRRLRALGRGDVGAVASVEEERGRLWIAGTRGLLRISLTDGPVETLAPRPLLGLAIDGGTLYVLDDRKLYAAPLADARGERFQPVLDVGPAFGATGLRVAGGFAVVLGRKGVMTAALRGDAAARPLARLDPDQVGRVADVAIEGSRAFLLGERGLQVVDLPSGRVVDSVDVAARGAIGSSGRHLVVLDGDLLQVVDGTPWALAGAAALDRSAGR